jgi:hypothetical protein
LPTIKRLLVIGGASFDRLHFLDRTVDSVGGAGMYTAKAARRCGAQVAMFGLCPDPCPERLKPGAGHLTEWLGPTVPPAHLPRSEISYRQGKTDYLKVSHGDDAMLSPNMLPADLPLFVLLPSLYANVTPTPLKNNNNEYRTQRMQDLDIASTIY